MQISPAIVRASSAISLALKFVCLTNARAAESAYIEPEPIASKPSSEAITSPFPESKND